MHLVMVGGDTSLRSGKTSPYYFTLQSLSQYFERIDVLCNEVQGTTHFTEPLFGNVYLHPYSGTYMGVYSWIRITLTALHTSHPISVLTCLAFPPYIHVLAVKKSANILGVPVVYEWHGIPKVHRSSLRESVGAVFFALVSRLLRTATHRSVSTTVTKALQSAGVRSSAITQAEAVYLDKAIHYPLKAPKVYTAVFCGRIDGNKRLHSIVRAIARLPSATLAIIGDGPQCSEAKALASQLGITERLTWFGYKESPADIAAIYRQSQLLIMPSVYEGGPRVVVEALACGIPVLATKVGIVPDVVIHGKNGVICTGSVQSIADGIKEIIGNHQYSDYAFANAYQLLARFDRSVLIKRYVALIQDAEKQV